MMDRAEVMVLGSLCLDDCIHAPPDDARLCIIRVTSGTSGSGLIVIATSYDTQAPERLSGDSGVERMVTCLGSLNARLANVLIGRHGPDTKKIQILPLDPQDIRAGLDDFFHDFRPQGFHGFCSFVLNAVAFIPNTVASEVVVVKLTGELLTKTRESFLHERLPNARQTEIYIATEAGGSIANRCMYLPRNHFHPMPSVAIEIESPDDEGFGYVLISKELFRSRSITRYRIGDVGRVTSVLCPCGYTEVLELWGRQGSDYMKLCGAILRREEFDRVAALFGTYIDDYQVEVTEVLHAGEIKGNITLRIYWHGQSATPALCEELAQHIAQEVFITPTQTLADLIRQGLFLPLTVLYSADPLKRGHKDIKFLLNHI